MNTVIRFATAKQVAAAGITHGIEHTINGGACLDHIPARWLEALLDRHHVDHDEVRNVKPIADSWLYCETCANDPRRGIDDCFVYDTTSDQPA